MRPSDIEGTFKDAKERWIAGFERDYIASLLKKNTGNISHAAREAEIDRKYKSLQAAPTEMPASTAAYYEQAIRTVVRF